jgi:hypothetical protein
MSVDVLVPRAERQALGALIEDFEEVDSVPAFDEGRVRFMADLSRDLRRRGRGRPEIEALAFWMRPAEVTRLHQQFRELGDATTLLMPRGTVFHVPPANVDTIFVYSLVLSLLTGNRNVVRLSGRSIDAAKPILDAMRAVCCEHPVVAASLKVITYGHEDAISRALTDACDVRVLWGGDATIAAFRRLPLPPHATELAFADRFSMSAFKVDSYLALPDDQRTQLADRFVNDTYWFDQLGCSSARLIAWVGKGPLDGCTEDFHARVRERAAAKGYSVDAGAALGKLGQSFRSMIDGHITGFHWYDNSEVVLDTDSFPPARGEFCGSGLFYQWAIPDLATLVPHVRREDQTLATFGFLAEELRDLATRLQGRGIDRIVPVGQALAFNRVWDGHDLLQAFTRLVTIRER